MQGVGWKTQWLGLGLVALIGTGRVVAAETHPLPSFRSHAVFGQQTDDTGPTPAIRKEACRLLRQAAQSVSALPDISDRYALLLEIFQAQEQAEDAETMQTTLDLIAANTPPQTAPADQIGLLYFTSEWQERAKLHAGAQATLRQASEAVAKLSDAEMVVAGKSPFRNISEKRDEMLREFAQKQAEWHDFEGGLQTAACIKDHEVQRLARWILGYEQAKTGDKEGALQIAAQSNDPWDMPTYLQAVAEAQEAAHQHPKAVRTLQQAWQAALAMPPNDKREYALEGVLRTLIAWGDSTRLLQLAAEEKNTTLRDSIRLDAIQALWHRANSANLRQSAEQCFAIAETIQNERLRAQAFSCVIAMQGQAGDEAGATQQAEHTIGKKKALPLIALARLTRRAKEPEAAATLQYVTLNPEVLDYRGDDGGYPTLHAFEREILEAADIRTAADAIALIPKISQQLGLVADLGEAAQQRKDIPTLVLLLQQAKSLWPQLSAGYERSYGLDNILRLYNALGDRAGFLAFLEAAPTDEAKTRMMVDAAGCLLEKDKPASLALLLRAAQTAQRIPDATVQAKINKDILRWLIIHKAIPEVKSMLARILSAPDALQTNSSDEDWSDMLAKAQALLGDSKGVIQTLRPMMDMSYALYDVVNTFADAGDFDAVGQLLHLISDDEKRRDSLVYCALHHHAPRKTPQMRGFLSLAERPQDRVAILRAIADLQIDSKDRLAAKATLREAQAQFAQIKEVSARLKAAPGIAALLSRLQEQEQARALLRSLAENPPSPASVSADGRPPYTLQDAVSSIVSSHDEEAQTPLLQIAEAQQDIGAPEDALQTLRRIPDHHERSIALLLFARHGGQNAPETQNFAWAERNTEPQERVYALLGCALQLLPGHGIH